MLFNSIIILLTIFALLAGIILQVFIPGFPKETILIQSGILFGFYLGSLINWLGMVLAAQLAYEVVRKSVETGGRYSKIIAEYQNSEFVVKLERSGNLGLFILRLLPFSPNDLLSLLAGALKLPRKGFFIVSIITAVPFAMIFAYLGSIGTDYFDRKIVNTINLSIMLFSILGYILFSSYIRLRDIG